MHLLWSKANTLRYPQVWVAMKRDKKDPEKVTEWHMRRVDEVNRRMRQWLAQRPPLLDQHGREIPPYMQLDSVPKPDCVKLLTGETVEYKGP